MKKLLLRTLGSIVLVCALLLLPGANPAQAQVLITPSIGAVFGGDVPSSRATFGASLAGVRGLLGAELDFGYTPTLFKDGSAETNLLLLTGNVLVRVPLGVVNPYAVGGIGLMRRQYSASLPGFLNDITDNDFGLNLGGGLWTMLTEHVGLRGDVRFFHIRKTDGFSFGRAYAGLTFAY
jgi:opacity protein-like surface antigen